MDDQRKAMWEEYFALARERVCPSKTPGLDPALVKRYNDRVDTVYKAELCTQEYSRSINEFHEQTTETGRDIRRLFFFSFLMLPMVAYVLGAQYHWFSVSIPYKLLTTLCRNFTIAGLLYSGFLTVIYVIRRIIYRNTRILRHTAFFLFRLLLFGYIFLKLRRGETLYGSPMNWFLLYFAASFAECLLTMLCQTLAYRRKNRELIQRMKQLVDCDVVVEEAMEDTEQIAAFTDEKLRELNRKYSEDLSFSAPMPWFDYKRTDKVRGAFRHLPMDYDGGWHPEFIELKSDEFIKEYHCEVVEQPIEKSKLDSLMRFGEVDPYCGLGDPGGQREKRYVAVYAKWKCEIYVTVERKQTQPAYADDEAYRREYDEEKYWEDMRTLGQTMWDVEKEAEDPDIREAARRVNQQRSIIRSNLHKPKESPTGGGVETHWARSDNQKVLGAVLVYDWEKLVGLYYGDNQEAYDYVSKQAEGLLGMRDIGDRDLRYCLYNGMFTMSTYRKKLSS